jgi:hypothetical protein
MLVGLGGLIFIALVAMVWRQNRRLTRMLDRVNRERRFDAQIPFFPINWHVKEVLDEHEKLFPGSPDYKEFKAGEVLIPLTALGLMVVIWLAFLSARSGT